MNEALSCLVVTVNESNLSYLLQTQQNELETNFIAIYFLSFYNINAMML